MSAPPLRALAAGLACLAVAGCGGSAASTSAGRPSRPSHGASSHGASSRPVSASSTSTAARRPGPPRLLAAATATGDSGFVPAVSWQGRTAVWIARRPGLALMSFSQPEVVLHLHSGTLDAGPTGWRWGPDISSGERRSVIAGFNGGFQFTTDAGGFVSHGRVAVPPQPGLGSIVTYSNGYTDIGAWGSEVPTPGRGVVSVRQNLRLLIDHGQPAATTGCLLCWGATLGGVVDPARSALGITADGHLVWVGGEHLTVAALASTLLAAKVVRAVELDINPEWVAGYLYGHRAGRGLAPVPVVPGQPGIPGQLLTPYSRDFFVVVAR